MKRAPLEVSLPAGRNGSVLVSRTASGKSVTLLAFDGKHRVSMTPYDARRVAEALLRAAMDAEQESEQEADANP